MDACAPQGAPNQLVVILICVNSSLNYPILSCPGMSGFPTWSAFTFEQMIPQKISLITHVKNAEAIMRLSARSKTSRLDFAHGVDLVSA